MLRLMSLGVAGEEAAALAYETYAAAPEQCASAAEAFAATPARAKKIDVHAEREVDALWVEINVHKAARDELYVVLKSLQESIEAAKSGTALYYQLSDGSRQIRVKIRNESNALHALHARKDEISAAINGVVRPVATGRRRRR